MRSTRGFTMIELLIAVAAFAMLVVVGMAALPTSLTRARDSRKKNDLRQIKQALEDYVNDNTCYPDESEMDQCGGTQLSPYMNKFFCEQGTTPYTYIKTDCRTYALYTNLELTDDEDIDRVGCRTGCGPNGAYNYGVSNQALQ